MARLPRLRSRFLLLAAGSVLPVLCLCVALAVTLVDREENAARLAALDRNRALVSAVDALVQGHVATLRALAAARSLRDGDRLAFHELAKRVLADQPEWRNVLLVDATGQQVVNARFQVGAPLPREAEAQRASLRTALATRQPQVGSLGTGPVSGIPGIPVQLPVVFGDSPDYALQLILKPDSFAQLVARQGYPSDWAAGIVDANRSFVARQPARAPRTQVSGDLAAAMKNAPEGWFRGRTLEGVDTFTAFVRSPLTGWTVAVAVPRFEVLASARSAVVGLAFGAVACIALAAGLAFAFAQRFSRPIATLAEAAREVGGDDAAALAALHRDPGVQEVMEVAQALELASSSLRERESLLSREHEALRAADKAKDEFLAMLGHELRNPLSAITSSAHVLRLSAPGSDTTVRAHKVIERQARQMTRLVEDLLDISRLAMGKVSLQRERLDLAALAERVVQTWQHIAPDRAGRVSVIARSAWIDADRARIEQVLGNLLDNASKFSAPGEPIVVEVHSQGEEALLVVHDRGRGIADADLERIFEPFVQGPQSFDRPQGGIGLGLTLVRRLLQMHGGSVRADSEGPGHGARFTVRLPLAAAPAAHASDEIASSSGPKGRRILLVEDNEDGRQMMQAMLELEGHRVRGVAGGHDAIRMVQEWQPDIALVDIGLPDIDGHELARRIRALALAHPPRLVALSGFGQPEDQRRSQEAGFDLHLVKPVEAGFLCDVLAALTAADGPGPDAAAPSGGAHGER